MTTAQDKIAAYLQPKLEELECFLVELKFNPAGNHIEVFADNPNGIDVDTCAKISRDLQFQLDHDSEFPEVYSLDVSSPGMDRPFRVEQQYKKNFGKSVEVLLNSGIKKTGILVDTNLVVLILDEEVPVKSKAKHTKPVFEKIEIPFEDIKQTKVKIKF